MFPEPMFPSRPTYVPRFAVNDSSTPPRLIFLSLQIDMIIYIIVIFALVVSVSVRRGRHSLDELSKLLAEQQPVGR